NQMLIQLLLEEYGIEVDIVENGEEAIEKVKEKDYNLVFMDINMPVMGGVEATKKIREFSNIPIVALTANAIVGDRERFLNAGMDNYLTKPIDVKKLKDILIQYLNSKIAVRRKEIEMIPVPENNFPEVPKSEVAKELGLPEMFVDKLIQKFVDSIDENMKQLEEAISAKDGEAIKNQAHKIKGSSANLRFNYLAEIMKTIEYSGKDGIVEGYEDLIATAKREIEKIKG
ncbi:MAG TPA: response regulator, partial [Campylobacterales bacterium]|nr:response regulator [Campylobacterales bacterium]